MFCPICGAPSADRANCAICGASITPSPPETTPPADPFYAAPSQAGTYPPAPDPFAQAAPPHSPTQPLGGWQTPTPPQGTPSPPSPAQQTGSGFHAYDADTTPHAGSGAPHGFTTPPGTTPKTGYTPPAGATPPTGWTAPAGSPSPTGWNAPSFHTAPHTHATGPDTALKTCPKCASIVRGTFCTSCGFSMAPSAGTWHQAGPSSANMMPPQKTSTAKIVVIVLGGLLALGLLAFFAITFLTMFMFMNTATLTLDENGASITINPAWPDEFPDDSDFDDGQNNGGMIPDPADPQTPEQPTVPDPDPDAEPQDPQLSPNGVSQAEFDQIEIGMTYLQISAIIGGDGFLMNDSGNGDYTVYWPGEDNANASLSVVFQNGKAVTFEQSGFQED